MKIGVIGTGNMGGALLDAFSKNPAHSLTAYNRSPEKLQAACQRTGAAAAKSAQDAARGQDLVLLAVKPKDMEALLRAIAPAIGQTQIVVSVAVGLPISFYREFLDCKLVRAMPNTPAAVQAGMTALTFGEDFSAEERQSVLDLFAMAGATAEVPESQMNAVSALAGSSPAFAYMFLEAMADAGCLGGIPRDQAYTMAAQAMLGAAKMVLETGKHPAQLKDEVCSPGGTTIRGVARLERGGFRGTVMDAIQATMDAAK
jgi:pyrroline-5-carboxylate reductase